MVRRLEGDPAMRMDELRDLTRAEPTSENAPTFQRPRSRVSRAGIPKNSSSLTMTQVMQKSSERYAKRKAKRTEKVIDDLFHTPEKKVDADSEEEREKFLVGIKADLSSGDFHKMFDAMHEAHYQHITFAEAREHKIRDRRAAAERRGHR